MQRCIKAKSYGKRRNLGHRLLAICSADVNNDNQTDMAGEIEHFTTYSLSRSIKPNTRTNVSYLLMNKCKLFTYHK